MPPSPIGFSRLWFGPATKPSSEMEIWHVTELMLSRRPLPARIIAQRHHLSHPAMRWRPGAPDAGAPGQQFLVARRSRLDREHVGHGQRSDIRWWVESRPPCRGSAHPDVRLLDLAARQAAFNRQVEAGERESRANRGSRLTNML